MLSPFSGIEEVRVVDGDSRNSRFFLKPAVVGMAGQNLECGRC
jgi:hypothetical protein